MGLSLGSIVSDITSLATDPGKAVKDLCDAVLPQNMKAIGDIAGGALDFETGHPLQALGHLTDALKDLPQMAQSLSTATANPAAAPVGTAAAEPAPPTPRAPAAQPATTGSTVSAGGSSTASAAAPSRSVEQITISVDANGRGVTISERAAPPPSAATTRAPTSGTTTRAPTSGGTYRAPTVPGHRHAATGSNTVTVTTPSNTAAAAAPPTTGGGPSGTTSSAASAATVAAGASAGTVASGSSSSTPSPSTAATGASDASASTSGSKGTGSTAAPSSLSDLMALSPDQFMQAVTSGKIPPDVANNPSAMTQIQARMDQITQMNQLVTSMMAAMHQMQMSIIQNIRV